MAKPPIDYNLIQALNSGVRECLAVTGNDLGKIPQSWLRAAVITYLMVHLNDTLKILDIAGHRLTFADDLPEGRDITDQVKTVRNAMCHIGSGLREMDEFNNRLSFGFASGAGTLVKSDEMELSNPYDDDQAIFMGDNRLLVKRHIHRAILEAKELGPKIAKDHGFHWHPLEFGPATHS